MNKPRIIKNYTYKIYRTCRFCKSKKINLILDLGKIPLAGGFLKSLKQIEAEKKYPLRLYFCSNCYLVQTNYVINKDTLFKNYYYASSKIQTLTDHFKAFSKLLKSQYKPSGKHFIVEIGANDGVFLRVLKQAGFKVLGVDPSNVIKTLTKENIPFINNYFSLKLAKIIVKKYGQANIIVSSNTLAHIEDMHDIFNGINYLLKPGGVLIFENHYLLNLIKEMQYDMVYHEHQYYYSLLAISNFVKQFEMEMFDAEVIPTHAGSIRVFVQKKTTGVNKKTLRLKKLLNNERKLKLDKLQTYKTFGKRVKDSKTDLLKLLLKLKTQGKNIVGYGASGRGTVLSNYCELDRKILDYVVDDSSLKQNHYTPGNHLKIYSSGKLIKEMPDYALLFAWAFTEEIKKRNKIYLKRGGKFIIPLPKVEIIK
jgi:methylation protein EvaC